MSGSDMPELGSKISLISKADIRYEGKLYTVDPQDCTIALANVRSFGTEDRKTAHPVPPQNQIYDYILFRATDIKDISVVPPTQLLYDPAIVQLSAPSTMNNTRSFAGSSSSTTPANDYHPLSMGGGGGGGSAGGGGFSGFNPMQSNILTRPSPSEFLHHQTNSESVLELLSGSRSSTPGLRRNSPTVEQGTQSNSRKSPQKDDAGRLRNRSGSRNQERSGNRSRNDSHNNQQQAQQHHLPQQQQQQSYQNRGRSNYNQQGLQQHHQGGNRGPQQQQYQGRNQMRNNQQGGHQQGDRWNNRNRNNGQPQQGNRQHFQRAPGARAKPTPLKFESDYDFDKANNEFEELRNELSKMKLDAPALPVVNGEEKKDDSGNETCAEPLEPTESDAYFYNKNKSFFDNISCEAIERSKGIQRTDWRKERKLNSETFGVSSARRGMYYGRGGMRGGYGYHYNRGGYSYMNRGGFRQPMMMYRQRSQNRPQTHNQAQVANA